MTEGLQKFIKAYDNLADAVNKMNFDNTKNITLEDLIKERIDGSLIYNTILQYYKNVLYDDITSFVNFIKTEDKPKVEEEIESEEEKIPNDDLFNKFISHYKVEKMLTLLLVRKNIKLYQEYLYKIIEGLDETNEDKNILKDKLNDILKTK